MDPPRKPAAELPRHEMQELPEHVPILGVANRKLFLTHYIITVIETGKFSVGRPQSIVYEGF